MIETSDDPLAESFPTSFTVVLDLLSLYWVLPFVIFGSAVSPLQYSAFVFQSGMLGPPCIDQFSLNPIILAFANPVL